MTKKEVDILFWLIILLLLLVVISSCNMPARPEYFNDKLKHLINMDNQIGAMVEYNNQRFNSPAYINERLYQQFNGMPTTQLNFQVFKKIKSKYGIK